MMAIMADETTLDAEVERSRELAARLRETLARRMAAASNGLRRAVRERPAASVLAAVVAGFAVVCAVRYFLAREAPAETQPARR